MKLLLSVLVLASLASSDGRTSPTRIVQAWYFPLQWDTLEPLNESDVRSSFDVTSCFRRRSEKLRTILDSEGQKTQLSPGNLRVIIDFSDGVTYLMDKHGRVKVGDKCYALSPEKLRKLKEELQECLPPPPGK